MWVIHSWPWYWLVWPWWGARMYQIVKGVTLDIGVPSTYLDLHICITKPCELRKISHKMDHYSVNVWVKWIKYSKIWYMMIWIIQSIKTISYPSYCHIYRELPFTGGCHRKETIMGKMFPCLNVIIAFTWRRFFSVCAQKLQIRMLI